MSKTWEEILPYLNKQWTKGKVHKYDGVGFTRELTDENKEKIKEIEEKNEKLKVIAVIDGTYTFTGGNTNDEGVVEDVQRHVDYLLLDEEGPMVHDENTVLILSYTVNETYGEEEMGDILVVERTGLLKRVG